MEEALTFLFTGVTNFMGAPLLVLFFWEGKPLNFFVSFFSFMNSLMYHVLDSFKIQWFFLHIDQWHRMDNIGSANNVILFLIHLMENKSTGLDAALMFGSFYGVYVIYERDPWKFDHPGRLLLAIILIGLFQLYRKWRIPSLNRRMLYIGGGTLLFAVVFFIKGLDEATDPCRFFHGMWHFCVAISLTHLWQILKPAGEEIPYWNLFLCRHPKELPETGTDLSRISS
jgi:predicted membrane channel-forming protein YqfA (hemolysin III family)